MFENLLNIIKNGTPYGVQVIIGFDEKEFGWGYLHWAAYTNTKDIIKIALQQKEIDPNEKDSWGVSSFFMRHHFTWPVVTAMKKRFL